MSSGVWASCLWSLSVCGVVPAAAMWRILVDRGQSRATAVSYIASFRYSRKLIFFVGTGGDILDQQFDVEYLYVLHYFVGGRRPRRDGWQVLRDVPHSGLLSTLQETQRKGAKSEGRGSWAGCISGRIRSSIFLLCLTHHLLYFTRNGRQ